MTPQGPQAADVLVAGKEVAHVGTGLASEMATTVDCRGAWVGPGLVDLHAHLREPGEEWKEDLESGSEAAAAGGFTAVVAMPNTRPPTDAGHLARYVVERGRQVGLVEVAAAGCLTERMDGQRLAHLDELWSAGVRVFTDDGCTVTDAGLLRRAMEYLSELGGVVAQHAEDPGLSGGGQMHEGEVSSRLGMPGIPAAAEEVVIARDLALVRMTGARYHVQHVSTAGSLGLVRAAKAQGLPVTAEVTPHHLSFDHRALERTDPAFKMYPPLRALEDVEAVREGLADGTIDVLATDHAPHAAHDTEVPFEEAPRGVIGLETAASALHTALRLGPVAFFERLSVAPARIAELERQGRWVEPGSPAHLVVFDPAASWVPDQFVSRAANSPFRGRELRGLVRMTVFGGATTWRDGKVQR
ncbi:MAG: dihydroorotase [Actinomycetota bacterium]|nr:dihydroorotase [Actinomycetota bacterium]